MAGPIARRRRPGRTRKLRIMRSSDEWKRYWRHAVRGWPAKRHLKKPAPGPGAWWALVFPGREGGK